jgi:hypothetical protein
MKPLGVWAFILAVAFVLLALFSSQMQPAQCHHEWEMRSVPGYKICGTDCYGLPVLSPDTVKCFRSRTVIEWDSIRAFVRCLKCGERIVLSKKKTWCATMRDSINAAVAGGR